MQHIPTAQRIFDLAVFVELLLRLDANPFCWHRQPYSKSSCYGIENTIKTAKGITSTFQIKTQLQQTNEYEYNVT